VQGTFDKWTQTTANGRGAGSPVLRRCLQNQQNWIPLPELSAQMALRYSACAREQTLPNAPVWPCYSPFHSTGRRSGYAGTGSIGVPRIARSAVSAASQATLPNLFIQ
jgi:hypothetical protein